MTQRRAVVAGAGGFIGHHLVSALKARDYWVRGVDIKLSQFEPTQADQFLQLDLRHREACLMATADVDEVYQLAADMGGMGYISNNHATILHNNLLINLHLIEAARQSGVARYFFSSSACVYPEYRQVEAAVTPLQEDDAYPAQPQDAYGWEKLVAEQLCHHYGHDFGLTTRVARFHNIYGPLGTWQGGREKAPAAIARKVAQAKLTGYSHLEIWGDGEQTRTFCYIDDCIAGILELMQSECAEPLNIGSDRLISINDLVELVCGIAGVTLETRHIPGPQGVRGRSSDNTRVGQVLGWQPRISLEEGMAHTYAWIEEQVVAQLAETVSLARLVGRH